MHKFSACACLVVIFGVPQTSHALGTLSRACQFSRIPYGTQTIAAKFFRAIVAPATVLDLPAQSLQDQSKYWILESLTTDYYQVRYYLFASSLVYGNSSISSDGGTYYYNFLYRRDSPWAAQAISDAMKADPDFAPFYVNRGNYYSVRAGESSIVEYKGISSANSYYVIGKHSYFDAVGGKVQINLPDTRAIDCNLGNWGFGLFDR